MRNEIRIPLVAIGVYVAMGLALAWYGFLTRQVLLTVIIIMIVSGIGGVIWHLLLRKVDKPDAGDESDAQVKLILIRINAINRVNFACFTATTQKRGGVYYFAA